VILHKLAAGHPPAMGGKAVKAFRSALSGPAPPKTFSESNTAQVTDVLGDARLLADYTVFLVEKKMYLELGYLRHFELFQDHTETYQMCIYNLAASWEAYRVDPTGLGNFEDLKEWEMHDLPHPDIVSRLSQGAKTMKKDNEVDEDHPNYVLALSAAVGIHVATVCSSIIDAPRGNFSTWPVECQDAMKYCARRYKVPSEGSAYSPKLLVKGDFEIEEFAPAVFSSLRRLAGISNADYMESLCRTDFHFISFGSNSKSGEIFFFSHDSQYLLKTAAYDEARVLLDMSTDFVQRFQEEPRSMIGRYLGLYRLNLPGQDPRLFIIMRNVTTIPVKVQKTYDLKGSTRNRRAKEGESCGKDINFHEEVGSLGLAPEIAQALVDIHMKDCELLAKYAIMDYSVLVKLHYPKAASGIEELDAPQQFKVYALPQASGAAPRETWWRRQNSMKKERANPVPERVKPATIDPGRGISSADGSVKFFFGIIDCLVPYEAYPKVQYAGMQLLTCGKGDESSRVPPDNYAERQVEMFHKVCNIPLVWMEEE